MALLSAAAACYWRNNQRPALLAGDPATDRAALLALAASLSGLWDGAIASGASICAWAGVSCTATAGGQIRPTALCAPRRPLRRDLRPSWVETCAQSSGFRHGSLKLTISVGCRNLRGLLQALPQSRRRRLAAFSGSIPSGIGQLAALQSLDLGANGLSGPIPADSARIARVASPARDERLQ